MAQYTLEQILQHYEQLLSQRAAGQLSYTQFKAEVLQLRALDANGAWWMIDPRSGKYLRYDGERWVVSTPAGGIGRTPRPKAVPRRKKSSNGQAPPGSRQRTCLVAVISASVLLVCFCIAVWIGWYWVPESIPAVDDIVPTDWFQPPLPSVLIPEQNEFPAEQQPPATPPEQQTWLVMLYQDADDEILEGDIFIDINEAEMIGSSERVHIVSQIDRYPGAFSGDGDWTSAKRYLLTQDAALGTIASQEIADLGEVNMGDAATLVDFATWAILNYPADRYVLILSDHGSGWIGGWSDNDPVHNAEIELHELGAALEAVVSQTGIGQFDLIGFDACLMAQLEVYSEIAPYASYAVASEESEPALGWAYASFLGDLVGAPHMSSADLAMAIVNGYVMQDQLIVDDSARAQFTSGTYIEGASADEVAREISQDATLSAVDLASIPILNTAVNNLAIALMDIDQTSVAYSRTYAQAFDNIFGSDVPASYIDLGHFVYLLKDAAGDPAVTAAGDQVLAAIQQTVIKEMHGPERPGASGISFYFPNSDLFEVTYNDMHGYYVYTTIANRFASESLWDEFLDFHYTGRPFSPDVTSQVPLQPEPVVNAPGAGKIEIGPVTASGNFIGMEDAVTLSVDIIGENIAYIYLDVAYWDEEYNSFLTADMEFVDAEQTQEIQGVFYPDWGESGSVHVLMDWQPTIWHVSDGEHSEFALIYPVDYGAPGEDSTYAVDGIYTFAGSEEERDAIIYFGSDGEMREVYGFSGEGGTGASREITPNIGDQFTILEEWFEDGEFVEYYGGTLTFSGQPFSFESYYAYAGDYIVGFIVEDMDGNWYISEYEDITVNE